MSNVVFFKSLFAKNFRSVDNMGLTINFQSGMKTLVVSTDNGSGKSTLWRDALYYVIHDKPYAKGTSKTQLINSRSNKDSLVTLTVEKGGVEYEISRGQKPSVFSIKMDGFELNKEAVDFQELLTKIIGIEEKVFTNSIILGKDKFTPFVTMSTEDRRKYGDQMLDLGVLTKMSDLNKEDIKALTKKRDASSLNMNRLIAERNTVEAVIKLKKEHDASRLDTLKQQLAQSLDKKDSYVAVIDQHTTSLIQPTAERDERIATTARLVERVKADNQAELEPLIATVAAQEQEYLVEESMQSFNQEIQAKNVEYGQRLETTRATISKAQTRINERNKLVDMKSQFETKISALAEPVAGELCDHCGGVVPQEKFDGHMVVYNDTKQKLEQGLSKVIEMIAGFDSVEAELTANETELAQIQQEHESVVNEIQGRRDQVEERNKAHHQAVSEKLGVSRNNIRLKEAEHSEQLREFSLTRSNELDVIKHSIGLINIEISSNKKALELVNTSIVETERQIAEASVDNSTKDDEDKLTQINQGVLDETALFDGITKELTIRNLILTRLKDDGIKARIVENYLPFINDRINTYLEKLNFFVTVELDSGFELGMFSAERKGQTIQSLSSGQQNRIDIAVLMAWRDVARMAASSSCNVLVLDEVLESLSESGVADFLSMWDASEESKFTNLIVISQRKSEFEPMFDDVHTYKLVDLATVEVTD